MKFSLILLQIQFVHFRGEFMSESHMLTLTILLWGFFLLLKRKRKVKQLPLSWCASANIALISLCKETAKAHQFEIQVAQGASVLITVVLFTVLYLFLPISSEVSNLSPTKNILWTSLMSFFIMWGSFKKWNINKDIHLKS